MDGVSELSVDRSEGFGERLLGSLIDRAQYMPPHLIAPLVAHEIARAGGRDVIVWLQDHTQTELRPLAGEGLKDVDPQPIEGSLPGRAFSTDQLVQRSGGEGERLYLPMLDGGDRVGVISYVLDRVDDNDRLLARRLAGLVADLLVTKGMYTDRFFQARRGRDMGLAAEMVWQLLPPLTMITPQVSVAGMLEPAYDVGGDAFDYALNDESLHLAIFDAMGHGTDASIMAAIAMGAYRHARRRGVRLADLYADVDEAVSGRFGQDFFATAMMGLLDTTNGELTWINAGHPAPMLVRGNRVVARLECPPTLPVGWGGDQPVIAQQRLQRGDRVLFFTDGVVEERVKGGGQFGEERLADHLARSAQHGLSAVETVRRLNRELLDLRDGRSTDDATILLIEWSGDVPEADTLPVEQTAASVG